MNNYLSSCFAVCSGVTNINNAKYIDGTYGKPMAYAESGIQCIYKFNGKIHAEKLFIVFIVNICLKIYLKKKKILFLINI